MQTKCFAPEILPVGYEAMQMMEKNLVVQSRTW